MPKIRLPRERSLRVALTDATLREGQQGWRSLRVEECQKIYELLIELGGAGAIQATEIFLYTEKDRQAARLLKEYGAEYPKVIGWIRASRDDLRLLRESGLDETVVLCSISDYHIQLKLGLSRREALSKYLAVVEQALKMGIAVKCALEDVTRADIAGTVAPFASELVKLSEKYRLPIGVKLSDTLGLGLPFPEIAPPRGVPAVVRALREVGFPAERLEFHGHNDFGLAVANHLAAWLTGASLSNCTIMGVGERAGNCPLEVMLIHYASLGGRRANLKAIGRVREVVHSLGLKVPEFYPLIGSNAFVTKAGIHVDGLLKDPRIYLPFDPSRVLGISHSVYITPYSGRAGITFWLKKRGLRVSKDDPRVRAIHEEILKASRNGSPSEEDLEAIASKYFPEIASRAT